MKKIYRQNFLDEMSDKQFATTNDMGKTIYLQDFIMGSRMNMKIDSFDKNSKHGVRFINGNSLDCRFNNLELVELVDVYIQ
jgi:hypothetical protein